MIELLSPADIAEQLKLIGRWQHVDGALRLQLQPRTMIDGARLVQFASEIAEHMQHHPELSLSYQRFEVCITTHDSGGVTSLDVAFAVAFELTMQQL